MQNELSNTVNRRVSEGELDVPLLPGVLVDIMALVDDPDADVRRLADLVHRDPGLAAHVLRVANSPVFSARGGVVSLQQAVSRLGFRLLGEIAMSAVVIMVGTRFDGSWADGAMSLLATSFGVHCQAPAGLFTSSHS